MYKKLTKQLKEENKEYVKLFKEYLVDHNIDEKHIDSHLLNIGIYLYEFLPFYSVNMKEGCSKLRLFFFDWFPTHHVPSEYRVKKICNSLQKFYYCMLELEHIEHNDYDILLESIKYHIEEAYNFDHGLISDEELELL